MKNIEAGGWDAACDELPSASLGPEPVEGSRTEVGKENGQVKKSRLTK